MIGRSDGSLDRIRNIGIAAHIDAGKTTTTERILFYTGKTRRMGEVDDGEAKMDWMDLERERGITITSASTSCAWRGHRINLIDTPGHVDFTAEVERSLRILDGAICVFCAVAGVQPQSESIWRQAGRHGVPMLIYLNKMDRAGARFDGIVEEIRECLGANALPVQMPITVDSRFAGVVDLVRFAAVSWGEDPLGTRYTVGCVPPAMREEAEMRRSELLEGLSEADDAFLESWLGGEFAAEEIMSALRRATLSRRVFPLLCGASLRNRGVQPLLDAVVDFLPSPRDKARVFAKDRTTGEPVECPADDSAPLAALAFKTSADAHAGRLTYLRVYSGRLRAGSRVYNASRSSEERIARLLRMHANEREEVLEAGAGDIVVAVGLRSTVTGDTLCDMGRAILLEPPSFPEPMVSVVIEPRTREAQGRLAEAMAAFEEEDPTFRGRFDADTGQVVVSGMGELHLDVILSRLSREQGVAVNVGRPQVAYRETFGRAGEAEGLLDRRGPGRFARVLMRFEPVSPDARTHLEVAGGALGLPAACIEAVEQGLEQAAASGTLAGYPVVGVRATLLGGTYRDGDSSPEAFAAAASLAFRRGMEQSEPAMLEPVVDVEVVVPEESLGEVVAQLAGKQAAIEGVEEHEGRMRVRASVALRAVLGYATELRATSKGRGMHRAQFRGYRRVPATVAEEIVRKARGELR